MKNALTNILYFNYENPEYFWLFLFFIPIIAWYVWKHTRLFSNIKTATTQDFENIPDTPKRFLIHVPFVCRLIALSFVIVALSRPVSVDTYSDSTTYGVDIVLSMDVSTSMLAMDLKPDRIEAAKDVAANFINSRPFDRMGLVVFASECFTQCPLTTDHVTLLNLLNELECGMITDGTAIGMGLALAVNRLKESKAVSKVIVLLTDGENNSGDIDPLTAAELASKYGIRVYTIGVGKKGEVPYPTPYGTQMVQNSFDETSLIKIAKMTNGKYFRATNKNELVKIYNTIDSLEKTKIEDYKFTQKKEEFAPFALLAILMLGIEFLLSQTICKRFP
ncbi:MAG: VWA domain-containing protein [Bacteroidales bacterium]|nr:VWA domain-containing protein [Bacteroidales bacterium]